MLLVSLARLPVLTFNDARTLVARGSLNAARTRKVIGSPVSHYSNFIILYAAENRQQAAAVPRGGPSLDRAAMSEIEAESSEQGDHPHLQ